MIHFDFVAVGGCANDYEISSGGFDGDGAVLVDDRDRRLDADIEAIFLLGLGHCPRGQGNYHHHCELHNLPTIHKPFSPPLGYARRPSPPSTTHYGRERSKAI